jgi:hypothetical protein
MDRRKLIKSPSGVHYLEVDSAIAEAFLSKGVSRVLCTLNGKLEIHSAIKKSQVIGYHIHIGLATCKKLNIREGEFVEMKISADTTEFQFDMPEELAETLATDETANKVFLSLTAGNQRSIIYLVSQVKSSEKRIERSLKIAEGLKAGVKSVKLILK